jgi:RNA polymerase sigma-70 factor (ECF subfamily)
MAAPRITEASVGQDGSSDPARELEAFHRGDAAAIEACYRDFFAVVESALRPLLSPADRETVIHEVFWRLLSNPALRLSFQGGAMGAWLATVTRNLGIDYLRKVGREVGLSAVDPRPPVPSGDGEVEARLLLERFARDHLQPAWRPVFEARFLRQLSQREAAAALRINRTTLAYRELRIRHALRVFMKEDEP